MRSVRVAFLVTCVVMGVKAHADQVYDPTSGNFRDSLAEPQAAAASSRIAPADVVVAPSVMATQDVCKLKNAEVIEKCTSEGVGLPSKLTNLDRRMTGQTTSEGVERLFHEKVSAVERCDQSCVPSVVPDCNNEQDRNEMTSRLTILAAKCRMAMNDPKLRDAVTLAAPPVSSILISKEIVMGEEWRAAVLRGAANDNLIVPGGPLAGGDASGGGPLGVGAGEAGVPIVGGGDTGVTNTGAGRPILLDGTPILSEDKTLSALPADGETAHGLRTAMNQCQMSGGMWLNGECQTGPRVMPAAVRTCMSEGNTQQTCMDQAWIRERTTGYWNEPSETPIITAAPGSIWGDAIETTAIQTTTGGVPGGAVSAGATTVGGAPPVVTPTVVVQPVASGGAGSGPPSQYVGTPSTNVGAPPSTAPLTHPVNNNPIQPTAVATSGPMMGSGNTPSNFGGNFSAQPMGSNGGSGYKQSNSKSGSYSSEVAGGGSAADLVGSGDGGRGGSPMGAFSRSFGSGGNGPSVAGSGGQSPALAETGAMAPAPRGGRPAAMAASARPAANPRAKGTTPGYRTAAFRGDQYYNRSGQGGGFASTPVSGKAAVAKKKVKRKKGAVEEDHSALFAQLPKYRRTRAGGVVGGKGNLRLTRDIANADASQISRYYKGAHNPEIGRGITPVFSGAIQVYDSFRLDQDGLLEVDP